MTGGQKSTRERLGAVFFAFIMVTSMVAIGGAAFAGSASAQSNATTVTAQQVSTGDTEVVSLSGTSPGANTEDTSKGGSLVTSGSSISSQGNDSSVFESSTVPDPVTVAGEDVKPGTTSRDSLFGTVSLDINNDGSAEEVVYQLAGDGTDTDVFIDLNNNNDLTDGQDSVGTDSDTVTVNGIQLNFQADSPGTTPTAGDVGDGTDDLTLTATPNDAGSTLNLNAQTVDDNSGETVDFQIVDTDSDAVANVVDFDVGDNDDVSDSQDRKGISDGGSVTFDSGVTFDVALADDLTGNNDLSLTADTNEIAVRQGTFDASEGPFPIYFTDQDSDGLADTGPYIDFNDNQDLESGEGAFSANDDVTADALNEKYRVSSVSVAGSSTIRPVLRAGVTYDIRVLELGTGGNTAFLDDIKSDLISPADGATSSVYAQGNDFYSATFDSNGNATFSGITVNFAGTALNDGNAFTNVAGDDSQDESNTLDSYIGVNDGSGSGTEVLTLEVEPSSQLTNVDTTLDSIQYNEEQSVTVTVTDTGGNVVSNANVQLIQDASPDDNSDDTSTLSSGFTDSNGEYTATIQPSAAGEIDVRVTDDLGGQLGTPDNTDGINDVEDTTTTTVNPIELGVSPQQSSLTNGFSESPDFDITLNGDAFRDGQTTGATVKLRGEPLDEGDNFVSDETQFNTYGTDDDGDGGSNADGTLTTGDSFSNEESFAPDTTGTIDVAAEFQEDTGTTGPAEYNGTTTLDVNDGAGLNVQTDTSSSPLDTNPGNDGSRDTFNPVLTIQDGNAEGLKAVADGSLESNDFEEVSITITSTNGEFTVGNLDVADDGDNGEPDFNNTGDDLTVTSATVENGDTDTGTTAFQIEGVTAEQNTTLTFNVTATTSAGDTFSDSVTTDITDSDVVSDFSLPSDVETGQTADISLTVSDGEGTTLNNRQVIIQDQSGFNTDDDLFNVSETSSANVDAIVLNPIDGQIEFYTDGNLGTTADQTRPLTVNNGEYVVENVTIASAGVDHVVEVHAYDGTNPNSGEIRAQLDNVVTSAGVSAYTITSDVDPVLAGQDEQINLTVTENGNAVNGTELVELAGNTNIDQQGSAVDDVSGPSAVDTDGDSTENVIQATINADESGTDAVNVSTNLNDNSKTGSVSLDVVQPTISTNLTGDLTLGLTSSNVEITAEDPRDSTALQDTDLRLTATNTTYDIDASDGSNIIADADDDTFDQSSISIADGNNGYVNLDENGTAVLDVSTQENNAGDQPLTLDLAVQNDSASYFGDSPVGVGELSLVNAPNELDPGTDVSQTYQLVDANGNTVDLGTLQISGTGLDGNTQTKVTDEGFVNFDYTTSDSGTVEFKIQDSSDVPVNSDNNEFTVKTISVLEQVNLSLSADQTDVTPGDSVEFNLTREDFDRQTTGTLTIRNASGAVDTVSIDQTATVTFDEAGEFAVEASKPTRPSVGKSFTNASATISVQVGEGTDEELARFDSGDDGIIDRDEAVDAIVAFNEGSTIGGEEVTRDQAVQVIIAFNEGQTIAA